MDSGTIEALTLFITGVALLGLVIWVALTTKRPPPIFGKHKRRTRLYPYMSTSFVMVEKPSDGSRTPYYIEDMMHGTGYHRAINVYTGEEELIRESNVIEVL